jgi:hypothetical protein
MEHFVRSHWATLVALAVFVILAWVIGRPLGHSAYRHFPERVCKAAPASASTYGRTRTYRGMGCQFGTELRW